MEIKSLGVTFGDKVVFKNFNLSLSGGVTAIMGGSGVGKTTLLKAVAGIIDYTGEIDLKDFGYVFQEPRLIPNLTVLQNVALLTDRVTAENTLKLVELGDYLNYYPKQLSGGMAQRVNLARAFSVSQNILLDEAFSGLDYSLKNRLMQNFNNLFIRQNVAIMVTHDIEEAFGLADRVIVLGGEPCNIVLDLACTEQNKQKVLSCLNNL